MDSGSFRAGGSLSLAAQMGTVDAHVHLYPDGVNRAPAEWAEARGERHWATLCTRVRKDGRAVQGFPCVDELLREMDAAGVERAVLLGWYWENHATCVEQNRFYAGCVRAHPQRLMAFATLHPGAGREAAMGELERAVDDGLAGLGELSPHSQGFAVDDPVWREVLAWVGERGLPVNLHVTEPAGGNYPGKVATPPKDFVWMAREHPHTTFILAHLGGRLPLADAALGGEARALANVYYDTAAAPLIYGERTGDVLKAMISAVGAERILFGSDYPLALYPRAQGRAGGGALRVIEEFAGDVCASGLSVVELRAVFGGTAGKLLPGGCGRCERGPESAP